MKTAQIFTAALILLSATVSLGASCNSNISGSSRDKHTAAPPRVTSSSTVNAGSSQLPVLR